MVVTAVSPSFEYPAALEAGTVLLHRGDASDQVLHLVQGKVVLGFLHEGEMLHQLGEVQGPCWLEAAAGLLGLPHVVDAVALTPVQLQYVAAPEFLAQVQSMPGPSQTLVMDMAKQQRQQTELAVSRLAKDADARCAEWLLRHAEPDAKAGGLAVTLRERKRTIAAQLGIAPETFSRVLRHLRDRQLISGAGRVLGLPNPQALRELAGV
ncbi:Crp/Fnr family transcriptional regulator [Limnohabitans lacus]|jgi:CRP-like cAMP-binding protein|uniref:Crp/Fnr family transcriptional regulator n=1 Tax=Limnohabitans lacus TaxID=3045173 RepID=A0ABT6X8F2_9BURK|nr:Crp/Fnr family transcriptional regulator [Limnohabitans sp. HM2-2]MDI9234244.1 Crp/Fnr family transcriptional regulator [Limnohabitans sp. HM2-2]